MTTARVISFYPHVVGRRAEPRSTEPVSPFEHLMERRGLTPPEIVHRQRMLWTLYAKRADVTIGPADVDP